MKKSLHAQQRALTDAGQTTNDLSHQDNLSIQRPMDVPRSAADILALQRQIGNRAVIRQLQPRTGVPLAIQRVITETYTQWKAAHATASQQPDSKTLLGEYRTQIIDPQALPLVTRLRKAKALLETADQIQYGALLATVTTHLTNLRNAYNAFSDKNLQTAVRINAVIAFPGVFDPIELSVTTDQALIAFETANQNKMNVRTLAEQGGATAIAFGTEFTFTNDQIKRSRTGYENAQARNSAPEEDRKANKFADQKVVQWKDAITSKYSGGRVNGYKGTVGAVTTVKGEDAYKVTYTDASDREVWWFVISRDDGCLETQTKPMNIQDATNFKTIIENDIFALAQTRLTLTTGRGNSITTTNLTDDFLPHEEIGGGHLSIDSNATFGNNGRLFRNFIVRYVNNMSAMNVYDNDRENAPNIAELPMPFRTAFRDIIGDYDTAYNDPVAPDITMTQLATRIQNEVYRWTLRTDQAGASPEKTHEHELHYQAINLEHLSDLDQSKRRVEMRRFKAQKGFNDLLAQLKMLQTLRDESRTMVGYDQQQGLEPLDEDALLEASVVDRLALAPHTINPDPDQRPEDLRDLHTVR